MGEGETLHGPWVWYRDLNFFMKSSNFQGVGQVDYLEKNSPPPRHILVGFCFVIALQQMGG